MSKKMRRNPQLQPPGPDLGAQRRRQRIPEVAGAGPRAGLPLMIWNAEAALWSRVAIGIGSRAVVAPAAVPTTVKCHRRRPLIPQLPWAGIPAGVFSQAPVARGSPDGRSLCFDELLVQEVLAATFECVVSVSPSRVSLLHGPSVASQVSSLCEPLPLVLSTPCGSVWPFPALLSFRAVLPYWWTCFHHALLALHGCATPMGTVQLIFELPSSLLPDSRGSEHPPPSVARS